MADQKLIERVQEELKKGSGDDAVVQALSGSEWTVEDIHGALAIQKLKTSKSAFGITDSVLSASSSAASKGNSGFKLSIAFYTAIIVLAGVGLYVEEAGGNGFFASMRTASSSPIDLLIPQVSPKDRTYTYTFATTSPAVATAPKASSGSGSGASGGGSGSVSKPTTVVTAPTTPSTPASAPATPAAPTRPTTSGKPRVELELAPSNTKPNVAVKLSWKTELSDTCTSKGFDTGGALSGSVNVTSPESVKYSLTCSNALGTITDTVRLSVDSAQEVPPEVADDAPVPTPDPVPTVPDPVPLPVPPVPVPDPTPVPVPDPVPPTPDPAPSSGGPPRYAVYTGCESPASTYAREVYIDPVNGSDTGTGASNAPYKSIATALLTKKIQPGDHVILLPGYHGKIAVTDRTAPLLTSGSAWTWFEFRSGAIGESMPLQKVSRIIVTGPELTAKQSVTSLLMWMDQVSNVVVGDGNLYTTKSTAGWTVTDWISTATSGMQAHNSTCVAIVDNSLTNMRGGIGVIKQGLTPSANSTKVLVEGNVIRNFSADGFVTLGSDITVRDNKLFDQYAGQEDGDANHDDGLQIFALGGAVFNNIRIEDNWFQESTDVNRPFDSAMQGIALFDGLVTNMKVTGNVVITSHWHGISLYGIADGLVDHNTVVNSTTNGRATWISIPAAKGGTPLPVRVKVSNNIAVGYIRAGDVTYENNQTVTDPVAAFKLFDRVNQKYDLHPKSGSAIDGSGAGAYPTTKTSAAENEKKLALNPNSLVAAVGETAGSIGDWIMGILAAICGFFSSIVQAVFG
ncbi:MAG: putative glucanase [Parcubacteria bacterium C7867-004]|nr:MAG: putative glucanase [Parcubacteria bacterium C7867-004]